MNQDELICRGLSVNYPEARKYLEAHGWVERDSKRPDVAIFRHVGPGSKATDVVLPQNRELADFGEAMVTVAARIAAVETRSVEAVLTDLTNSRADILRFVRTNGDNGTLTIEAAENLLKGARKSLLSAACSVVNPNASYHPRMTLKSAEDYLRHCRVAQTELGSYVIPILCPLDAKPVGQQVLLTPFGRETTKKLMTSLHALVEKLRAGRADELLDTASPQVTGNLCDALLEMASAGEVSDLKIAVSWSESISVDTNIRALQSLRIDRDLHQGIEEISHKLRPPEPDTERQFVGHVSGLKQDRLSGKPPNGQVTLQLLEDDGVVPARCELSPSDYDVAIEAHKSKRHVSVYGVLRKTGRQAHLENVRDFKLV